MAKWSITKLSAELSRRDGTTSLSLRERLAAQERKSHDNILLLDISGSMSDPIEGHWTKIDALWQIVQDLRSQGVSFRCATFNDSTAWSDLVTRPQPTAGTTLTQALEFITAQSTPLQITLVTDGLPWDEQAALEYAATLPCKINVMYVGPPNEIHAIDFCQLLASRSGGSYANNSLATEVLQLEASKTVVGLLTQGATQQRSQINL